jgi:uncharacterized protein YjbI with pentapeptide repeats
MLQTGPMVFALLSTLLLSQPIGVVAAGDREHSVLEFQLLDAKRLRRTDAECRGDSKRISADEIVAIVELHDQWLRGKPQGRRADLCGADLSAAQERLRRVNLSQADLRNAQLVNANLSETNLAGADLRKANLTGAKLTRANLRGADLSETRLGPLGRRTEVAPGQYGYVPQRANLSGADLGAAAFVNAFLFMADLSDASIMRTELSGANVFLAKWSRAVFEPLGSLPDGADFTDPDDLATIRFLVSPSAMISLREDFRRRGLRDHERALTYAIRHTERLQAWSRGWAGKLDSLFNLVAFEVTSAYGRSPGRPLMIVFVLMVVFAAPYAAATATEHGRSGIWVVWDKDRAEQSHGRTSPIRVSEHFPNIRSPEPIKRWPLRCALGLYFSLLSALRIGWRELSVGGWVARVWMREYTFQPTGWVRLVSGFQSLVSVYLVALWALAYFGRPFD